MTIRFAILTISDRSSRGQRPDASGPALVKAISAHSWQAVHREILPDEIDILRNHLLSLSESGEIDIIITTGGTGFSPRDITPEATLGVIERPAPGLVEAMRSDSLRITHHAMLSRAAAGIRGRTLIINLPGSPKGAVENFNIVAPVLEHAVQLLHDDPHAEAGHQKVSSKDES